MYLNLQETERIEFQINASSSPEILVPTRPLWNQERDYGKPQGSIITGFLKNVLIDTAWIDWEGYNLEVINNNINEKWSQRNPGMLCTRASAKKIEIDNFLIIEISE